MAQTLKKQYEARQVRRLQERLNVVDRHVITELRIDPRDRLIIEAFDKQQMAAAIDIVKKLKTIEFSALNSLRAARDAAVADTTKVLSGSAEKGLVRKIVGLFKSEKENPLVDTLAFASALNNFFDQFVQYVSALGGVQDTAGGGPKKGGDQTLGTIITGKSADELGDVLSVGGLGGEEKKKLAEFQKVIINGLKPEGALAKIGKNWIDKYMKGKKGLQQLANEMMKMTVHDLDAVAKSVSAGLKNASAVGQAAAGAASQAAVGTTGGTGPEVAQATGSAQGTAGTKDAAKAPGAQVAGGNAAASAKKVYDAIKSDFEGMDEKTVLSILTTLADNDRLKV